VALLNITEGLQATISAMSTVKPKWLAELKIMSLS